MEQQNQHRKLFQEVNAEDEFSDEVSFRKFLLTIFIIFHGFKDDINAMRVPNISSQRSRQQPSSSGFNFPSRSIPTSFGFAHKNQLNSHEDSDVQFISRKPPIPELVPISPSIPTQNGIKPNGYGSFPPSQNRRSLLDFTNKNRVSLREKSKKLPENFINFSPQAFNDPSIYTFKQSVLDRNHNLDLKHKYDALIKSLIPRLPNKGKRFWNFLKQLFNQFFAILVTKQVTEALRKRNDPIATVDLSSDETETSAGAVGGETLLNRYMPQYPSRANEFKKPSAFVELSDDEDTDPFSSIAPISSTIIKKNDSVRRSASFRRDDSVTSIPDVKPVNSLLERQQTRECLKLDALDEIYRRSEVNRQKNDSQINDVSKT